MNVAVDRGRMIDMKTTAFDAFCDWFIAGSFVGIAIVVYANFITL